MALNAEPADPVERAHEELPPRSYAEAVVEEAIETEPAPIDEDAIKESPPRAGHARNSSEPRPLGEVIDEVEHATSPGSPALRHPKGRLENKDSHESYAGAVKEHAPSANGLPNGDGHGMPVPQLPDLRAGSKRTNGAVTPDTFDGVGEDEAPRSPTRKAHKRVSSRSLNGTAARQVSGGKGVDGTAEKKLEPGAVIYENIRNKSGDNLASIKPDAGYELALQQREDKPPTSEQPADELRRKESELVSGRRAGAGWSTSAIRWAPLNVPLQRRLQTLIVLLHTLSIVGSVAIFFMLCAIPILWPILLPYLLYVLLSRASIDGELAHRSQWLRSSKIWSLFGSYFPARLHRSQELEPTRKYIFGYHPHGIISHGAFAAFATEALGFSQLFPGITNTLLTLDSNFRLPLYRDYALRMGLASVSRESCENILSKGGPNGEGMGRAITIVVGGARESLDALPYTLRLVLKRRKGFVKLAIRTGADLVPTLSFGENDLYDQLDSTDHPYVHKLQLLVKKFMGFTVPLFHARGVFNYDVGMMPYRRPVNIVVGRPIRIMQSKTPDPAYVDEIHKQYVDELFRIWEDWKDTFARHRQGELEIVE
ncbi:hypothetical protein PRZ48_008692 [Zasmidium cellare]|uniref:diacylglycerol O-acyltransferase n=1 Tax=Zasmidium cellare TaxID=395010 RepID=A0ABR0EHA1_ZASCE|nr:hypothetical protein PRZ48_008692 [Zasmidium cellare]